jgi:hypothetical protein
MIRTRKPVPRIQVVNGQGGWFVALHATRTQVLRHVDRKTYSDREYYYPETAARVSAIKLSRSLGCIPVLVDDKVIYGRKEDAT